VERAAREVAVLLHAGTGDERARDHDRRGRDATVQGAPGIRVLVLVGDPETDMVGRRLLDADAEAPVVRDTLRVAHGAPFAAPTSARGAARKRSIAPTTAAGASTCSQWPRSGTTSSPAPCTWRWMITDAPTPIGSRSPTRRSTGQAMRARC